MNETSVDAADDWSPWEPDPEARLFLEPAASRHAAWIVLAGDAVGRLPNLSSVLHLLYAQLPTGGSDNMPMFQHVFRQHGWADETLSESADEPIGLALYREAVRWVQDCTLADVGDLRIRIQLARALVAVQTCDARDDPNFTTLPPPRRRGGRGRTSG